MKETLLFVYGFIKKPFAVSTLWQSSRFLVSAVEKSIHQFNGERVIVELGAGLGRITRMLCEKLPANAELLCFEREPAFARRLKGRFRSPRVQVIQDDARNLKQHLLGRGHEYADCIVSAVPLNNPWGQDFLDRIAPCLRPGGKLIQVSMARGSIFDRDFDRVKTDFVLWNLPPERVTVCQKR